MTGIRKALVIGGGIAGPVTALALRKAGIEAIAHEAHPGTADGVGGALTLAPNGLAALRQVGVDEAIRAIGQPLASMVFEDGRGRRLGTLPNLPGLPPSLVMWRSDLCRVLRDHATAHGVQIEHGKRLVGVTQTATGVTARFADGSEARGDVLIGADGIRSTTRTLIDPDAPGPRHTGLQGFGIGGRLAAGGPDSPPCVMRFAFGTRAFFGYWNQPDGGVASFSNLPWPEPLTLAQARAIPAEEWLRRLREAHAGDVPAAEVLAQASADQILVAGPMELMPPLRRWSLGRMTLVGDSAHAPSATSGQGASLAVESAVELARCLRDLPDVPSAFAAYERRRRPRVERIAEKAAKANNGKAAGPVAKALMRLAFPVALRTFLTPERMFGAAHRFEIDWDAPVAV